MIDDATKYLMDERNAVLESLKQVQISLKKMGTITNPEELLHEKNAALQEIGKTLERYSF